MARLVFTCGDINGIGPEICIKTFNKIFNPRKREIIFLCPAGVFKKTLKKIPLCADYQVISDKSAGLIDPQKITVIDLGKYEQRIGKPTAYSGRASYNAIIDAVKLCRSGFADAMITAPISKTALQMAGLKFKGHTGLLASLTGSRNYMMVFLSDDMICGLATIHEPLKNVSRQITAKLLRDTIKTLRSSLISDLGYWNPEIAVLGLNPHSGEDGNLGDEEVDIITPVIKSLKNINVRGPFVPDSFFGKHLYKKYDAILGMYHDQVLIPFKMLNFEKGVNFTAGLPVVRTSPDHGTAFDIAGKGIADESSMIQAARWAEKIIINRKKI